MCFIKGISSQFAYDGKRLYKPKVMEAIAKSTAIYLSIGVEMLGAVIIGIALIRFIVGYVATLFRTKHHLAIRVLRVSFGSSLTLALELLLAADILRTAVAPTWDDIGKLAAIAAIRTILNYFLEKELHTINHEVDAATAKNM